MLEGKVGQVDSIAPRMDRDQKLLVGKDDDPDFVKS